MANAAEELGYASFLANLCDGFDEAFIHFSNSWTVLLCNATTERHMGFSASQALGANFWDLFPAVRNAPLAELLHQVMTSREPCERELMSVQRPDILLSLRAFPIGSGVGLVFRDVTDQRAAERRLRESEARFRATADSAPAAVWITDVPGKIEFVNQAFVQYAGRPREDLLGDAWLGLLHPEDIPQVAARRAAAREMMSPYDFEARFRFASGEYRWIKASAKPRIDIDGAFRGYVGLAIDTTETRRAQEHQQLLINELNHRVKNTLATIQSIARQTLREGVMTREARDRFTDRLMALSAAHNVLTRENWGAPELTGVATEAIWAYDDPKSPRIWTEGPSVRIQPNAALAISLALHELATNATKYGALSQPFGRVGLRWEVTPQGDVVEIEWREAGGPPVSEPPARGFGSRLLGAGLAGELGQPARMEWRRDGLICRIAAPVSAP